MGFKNIVIIISRIIIIPIMSCVSKSVMFLIMGILLQVVSCGEKIHPLCADNVCILVSIISIRWNI